MSARKISCDEGLSILGSPAARRREFRKLLKLLADGDAAARETALMLIDRHPDCVSEPEWPGEEASLNSIMPLPLGMSAQRIAADIRLSLWAPSVKERTDA